MVVQYQAGLAGLALLGVLERRAQPGDAGANDHEVVVLDAGDVAEVDRERAVTQPVRGLDGLRRVAVGVAVVADAAVPVPIGAEGSGAGGLPGEFAGEQGAARADEHAVDEVPAGDVGAEGHGRTRLEVKRNRRIIKSSS